MSVVLTVAGYQHCATSGIKDGSTQGGLPTKKVSDTYLIAVDRVVEVRAPVVLPNPVANNLVSTQAIVLPLG